MRACNQKLARLFHDGNGIDSGVGDASGEDGDDGRGRGMKRCGDALHLVERENGGDVDGDAGAREALNERPHEDAVLIGYWNLYVDVRPPGGDDAGLGFHAFFVVCEDFKRDRAVGNEAEEIAREGLVVEDAGLAHQRGVGGEALDPGIFVNGEDAGEVGSVGKELDAEIFNRRCGGAGQGNAGHDRLLFATYCWVDGRVSIWAR